MSKTPKIYLTLFLTILVIFLFFLPSVFFKVRSYDELMPFKETYLPVCFSFSEMFELISWLGLKQHFEAGNTTYSNIVSLRCNPFGNFLQLLIQVLFKKNPVNYHLYSLILHLINASILYILTSKVLNLKSNVHIEKLVICSLLVLLWAIHPSNIESVLLLTNANIVLSYTFSLIAIYLYLDSFLKSYEFEKISLLKNLLIFFTYSFALLTAEFHFFIPLVLISYTSILYLSKNKCGLLETVKKSIFSIIPFISASFIYIILFIFSNTKVNFTSQTSMLLIFERILWLSPQVLFHFLKLLLFPLKLSIDQTNLVRFGKAIYDPYAIFCIVFMTAIFLTSLYAIVRNKSKLIFFFLTISLFFIALVPYSQIIAPIYNFASERYLYFPSFIFIFGLSHYLNYYSRKSKVITFILITMVLIFGGRSYFRLQDWKNSQSLYESVIKSTNNHLFKAIRYKGLTPQDKIFSQYPEREVPIEYQLKAIDELNLAVQFYQSEKEKYQDKTPHILKSYGIDPESFLCKSGYLLSQAIFSLSNENHKLALKNIKPFVNNLSKLDSAGLAFYASTLYFDNQIDSAEVVFKKALELYPYSTRLIYPYCDLIQIKYKDLNQIEEHALFAYKYFPYDVFTLLVLTKIYGLKGDLKNFAKFSYVYGLRHHSIEDLENAYSAYIKLNDDASASRTLKRIEFLKSKLKR